LQGNCNTAGKLQHRMGVVALHMNCSTAEGVAVRDMTERWNRALSDNIIIGDES
jgi:hypothetical protein